VTAEEKGKVKVMTSARASDGGASPQRSSSHPEELD
jgi:hypothetical protein